MNEETIRRIIREEIKAALSESAVTDLVDYDSFKRELVRALRRAGADPRVVLAVSRDRDHSVEQAYDEMKQELTGLAPEDEASEVPDIVNFTCTDIVKAAGGTDEEAAAVAAMMAGDEPAL